MTYTDRIFYGYGVEKFGEDKMSKLTPEQIETARCEAMQNLHDLTEEFGKQPKGTSKKLFCMYIERHYF